MARKLPGGSHTAVGYWGNNPRCRIDQEAVGDKVKVLLQDKLLAEGKPVNLWLPVTPDTPGIIPCSCVKDTTERADYKCYSCYGTKNVPGFLRFQHETIFASSAKTEVLAGYVLTDTERDLDIKPNRLRLIDGALTGTIETIDKPFTNPDGLDWEFQVASFRKLATDVIGAEFSTDSGGTWTDLTLINGANRPTGAGNIRFRITLTRISATSDSPDFEILRIRRPRPEDQQPQIPATRSDVLPGMILILRTWYIEQALRHIQLGNQTNFDSDRSWTAPLDFFDVNITPDTPPAKINDRDSGPHPFYEHAFGVEIGERFPIFQVSVNENIDFTFTHQAFFDRRSQPGEVYGLIY